ncbi:2,3-bisphosphoglycerate-independent phosphoglycerate mutase [Candidatus Bathyarchaeota archaeon]|nr:2,3-bisphosphoglycerate-independent phosphoglycerate mutase [Candidatus Bathyarchaeota archaeon]
MSASKALLILCDGLGDRPLDALGGRTPLKAAYKPNLDRLARRGISGIMDPIAPGIRPGSGPAHLAIFGYDPFRYYTGRGIFEALGVGMEIQKGDIVFRFNFATLDKERRVIDRRAGRIREGTRELVKALGNIRIPGVELLFKEGIEHRGILALRGSRLGWKVSDTDPQKEGLKVLPCRSLDDTEESRRTADIINKIMEQAFEILENHPINEARKAKGKPPANAILIRGSSHYEEVPGLKERFGLEGACVAGGTLYKGVAKFVGMEVLEVKGATGTYGTDFRGKFEAAIKGLEDHNFVFLHFKAPDLAGEDGDSLRKIEVIERIDKAISGIEELRDTLIIITADHSTPCALRTHSGDPVPIVISGPGVRVDGNEGFDEFSASKGGLGRIRGLDLMPILADLLNLASKFGA